jgi:hypothetical protein
MTTMKTYTPLGLAAVLAATTVIATTRDASALGPLDLEIGAKAGVGTAPSSWQSGAPNPLGFGLGGRAGVAIMGIYGGVNFVYYFGGSEGNVPIPIGGGTASLSVHSMMYGVEAGYGFTLLDMLTIRPQVGLGNFTMTTSFGSSLSRDDSNVYVEPGVTAFVTVPGLGWFVGADANLLVLPGIKDGTNGQSNTDTAFTLHGQIGYKF